MYEAFYGFRVKPFAVSPQEEFIFLSRQHRMALELLVYGLRNQAMFCVVTGDIGTGKTTLMRHLLNGRGPSNAVAMITGTLGTFTELLQWILSEFGVEYQGLDKIALQQALVQQLKWVNARNKRVVLVIDEAQTLAPEVLEELRLFSNINAGGTMLLQTVLVGQLRIARHAAPQGHAAARPADRRRLRAYTARPGANARVHPPSARARRR